MGGNYGIPQSDWRRDFPIYACHSRLGGEEWPNRRALFLFVDDDPAVCTSLRRLIRSIGMSPNVTSAQEFLPLPSTGSGLPGAGFRLPDLSVLNLQEKLNEQN